MYAAMNGDLYLVVGVITGVLALPALVGAYSEGRTPRAAAIMILIAGGLIVLAMRAQPGGYDWEDVPDAFVRVVGSLLK